MSKLEPLPLRFTELTGDVSCEAATPASRSWVGVVSQSELLELIVSVDALRVLVPDFSDEASAHSSSSSSSNTSAIVEELPNR